MAATERPAAEASALRAELAPLFEAAPRFLDRLVAARPFDAWASLFAEARRIAHAMPEAEQIELVDAHPPLGAPPEAVSDLSRREQGYDRSARLDLDKELARLNQAYEAGYGFRYCTFVDGRPREALVAELRATLVARPSRRAELVRAVDAVIDIASSRQRAAPGSYSGPVGGSVELGEHRYGKERIRLVRVLRGPGGQTVRDLTVSVSLDGDFEAAYTAGDNTGVVATDTMKNTAYALAGEHLSGSIEAFGLSLARHFIDAPSVRRATVGIDEAAWRPIEAGGAPATGFIRDGSWTRTARVVVGADGASVRAGLRDLTLMLTAGSSFVGFPRDRFTTLPETNDRLMATRLEAEWTYGHETVPAASVGDPASASVAGVRGFDFDAAFERVRTTLLATFAGHESASVQATIWILGRAVLKAEPAVADIRFRLPNLHHWLVDLSPFGMANDGTVFVATGEPFGLIEGTVRRSDAEA